MSFKSNAFLFVIVLFTCCTTSVTKVNEPKFNVSNPSLVDTISKLITCENINLAGKETIIKNKSTSELIISCTNGKNIPSDSTHVKILAKTIALSLKKLLIDKNQYHKYTILFVKKTTEGSMTKRSWTGQVFKSEEL